MLNRSHFIPADPRWLREQPANAVRLAERLSGVLEKRAEARSQLERTLARELRQIRDTYGGQASASALRQGAEDHAKRLHADRLAALREKHAQPLLDMLEQLGKLGTAVGRALDERLNMRTFLRSSRQAGGWSDSTELDAVGAMTYRAAAAQVLSLASDAELRGWADEAAHDMNAMLAGCIVAEYGRREDHKAAQTFIERVQSDALEDRRDLARDALQRVEAELARVRTELFMEVGASPSSDLQAGLRSRVPGRTTAERVEADLAELRGMIEKPPEQAQTPLEAMAEGIRERTGKQEPKSNGSTEPEAEPDAAEATA